jgi:2-dehydropantoate 2-reductase
MRYVAYGAGAIGGVIAARLFQAGHEVIAIARGAHGETIRREGLQLESPAGAVTLPIPAIAHPEEMRWAAGDVVLLTMKSQDTASAIRTLAAVAPADTPIVCLQNGVENERVSLRQFAHVYGGCVMCPAAHLLPGIVQAHSVPTTGILDIGRWPHGTDDLAGELATALSAATFSSCAIPDIARWKYAKLLTNLGNAIEAVCGPAARRSQIGELARCEGEACLRAAGIAFASEEEDARRRDGLLQIQPIADRPREGGSSWQSLARQAGNIETDYLNGEIVLLGRLHNIPTPVNELLCRLANRMAADRSPPGRVAPEAVLAQLAEAAPPS